MLWRLKLIFKDSFLNLSLLQKIEIYLIPPLLIVLIYININSTENENIITKESMNKKEISKYKQKINELKKKKQKDKVTQVQILKQYELLSTKLAVNITNISFQSKLLNIEFYSNYYNCMSFLKALEKMNKIISLIFKYENNKLYISSTFQSNNYNNIDINNYESDNNIANPFIIIKDKNTTNCISKAIIGEYVILGGSWYKVGDNYNKYKIYKIYNDYIELKDGEKITRLEIFNAK